MPKLKKDTVLPTLEEDAAITVAAMADEDALPYSDEEWETVKPHVRRGRPFAVKTKQRITLRLSPEVVDGFRASGAGWQSRMDAVLKEWIMQHPAP